MLGKMLLQINMKYFLLNFIKLNISYWRKKFLTQFFVTPILSASYNSVLFIYDFEHEFTDRVEFKQEL